MTDAYRYDYLFPVPLSGSREQIFSALTDAKILTRWFAEYADVGRAVGEPFRFWGRHTCGLPGPQQASQRIERWSDNDSVSFSWRLLERDSVVTWAIEDHSGDDGPARKIRITQVLASLPDGARADALIDDLWRIYTGCLCFYLIGESDFYRPDFADDAPQIRCEIVIAASPGEVFAALIEPEKIKQWFPAQTPTVDARVGGEYGFGFSFELDGKTIEPPAMTISAIETDRLLEMNWPDWRMDPNVPDQTIRWELTDLGDGRTRLVLRHFGFGRATDVSDYPFGWYEFLSQIQAVAQG